MEVKIQRSQCLAHGLLPSCSQHTEPLQISEIRLPVASVRFIHVYFIFFKRIPVVVLNGGLFNICKYQCLLQILCHCYIFFNFFFLLTTKSKTIKKKNFPGIMRQWEKNELMLNFIFFILVFSSVDQPASLAHNSGCSVLIYL